MMASGSSSQLHISSSSGSAKCVYSRHACGRTRYENYKFCAQHLLEDENSKFTSCEYMSRTSKRKCPNPARRQRVSSSLPSFCDEHIHDLNVKQRHQKLKRKIKKRKKTDKQQATARTDEKRIKLINQLMKHKGEPSTSRAHDDMDNAASGCEEAEIHRPITDDWLLETSSDLKSNADWDDFDPVNNEVYEPLRYADVLTPEEVVATAQSKLIRLQSLYIEQFKRLFHLLKEKRRNYLHEKRREDKSGKASGDGLDVDESIDEDEVYALSRYRRRTGVEELLRRQQKKRRLETGGVSTAPLELSPGQPRCAHVTNHTRCRSLCLPYTKFCTSHILEDPHQLLYKKCRIENCPNPVCHLTSQSYETVQVEDKEVEECYCLMHAPLPEMTIKIPGENEQNEEPMEVETTVDKETIVKEEPQISLETGMSSELRDMGTDDVCWPEALADGPEQAVVDVPIEDLLVDPIIDLTTSPSATVTPDGKEITGPGYSGDGKAGCESAPPGIESVSEVCTKVDGASQSEDAVSVAPKTSQPMSSAISAQNMETEEPIAAMPDASMTTPTSNVANQPDAPQPHSSFGSECKKGDTKVPDRQVDMVASNSVSPSQAQHGDNPADTTSGLTASGNLVPDIPLETTPAALQVFTAARAPARSGTSETTGGNARDVADSDLAIDLTEADIIDSAETFSLPPSNKENDNESGRVVDADAIIDLTLSPTKDPPAATIAAPQYPSQDSPQDLDGAKAAEEGSGDTGIKSSLLSEPPMHELKGEETSALDLASRLLVPRPNDETVMTEEPRSVVPAVSSPTSLNVALDTLNANNNSSNKDCKPSETKLEPNMQLAAGNEAEQGSQTPVLAAAPAFVRQSSFSGRGERKPSSADEELAVVSLLSLCSGHPSDENSHSSSAEQE